MKHFRPIKTFSTWLLHQVKVEVAAVDEKTFGKFYEGCCRWIESNLNLSKADHGDLRHAIYNATSSTFFSNAGIQCYTFEFPEAEYANSFAARFGGSYLEIDKKDSHRRNETISGNFTIDDLVYLYGNPLPNLIQFHLVDMSVRLGGYFDDFKHMHQDWCNRSDWIPSAFVFADERDADRVVEILGWFNTHLQKPDSEKGAWQKGWASSASGVYEFDDPHLAMMFKLRWGGNGFRRSYYIPEYKSVTDLLPYVSGIKKVGNVMVWESDPNVPDYRAVRDMSAEAL